MRYAERSFTTVHFKLSCFMPLQCRQQRSLTLVKSTKATSGCLIFKQGTANRNICVPGEWYPLSGKYKNFSIFATICVGDIPLAFIF